MLKNSKNDVISSWRAPYYIWNRNSCGPEISRFLSWKMRIYTQINAKIIKDNDFWLDQIASMSETPLFMNKPTKKKIAKIGQKWSIWRHMVRENSHYFNTANCCWLHKVTTDTCVLRYIRRKSLKRIKKHPIIKNESFFLIFNKRLETMS